MRKRIKKKDYLLLTDITALSPCTGIFPGPTRNVTSHKSGIARISFMLSPRLFEQLTFIDSFTPQDREKSSSRPHSESKSSLLSHDETESISQVSVDSYPDEESV